MEPRHRRFTPLQLGGMDAARDGLHRHDGDLQPAICLDAVRAVVPESTGAILSEVQWTITFLIVLQTWLSPLQGFLVEKMGPKVLNRPRRADERWGWIASSYITTLWGLYSTYGLLCGIGTGIVYIGIIGLMVKWFPARLRDAPFPSRTICRCPDLLLRGCAN